MSLACVNTRALQGLAAPPVTVEVHLAGGLPALAIVGLPETAVRESRDRVRAAILNSGFEFPRRRITVNLAPADLPKEGGRYDLPIAVGILAASGQVPTDRLDRYEFLGELALSGALRPVKGLLPAALVCARTGHDMVLPAGNARNGSHNLVVGPRNAYSQTGGVVFGRTNVINRRGASITGGLQNIASGSDANVSGGLNNIASGPFSSVSGGGGNTASGQSSSARGGIRNEAAGAASSVSGGNDITISGNCVWGGEAMGAVLAVFGDGAC